MRLSSLVRPLALPLLFAAALALAGCDATSTLSGKQNTPPTAKATVGASMVDVGNELTLDGSGSSFSGINNTYENNASGAIEGCQ